mgnify:CR=1 FL=1
MLIFIKMTQTKYYSGFYALTIEEEQIKRRRSEKLIILQKNINALEKNLSYIDLVKGTKYQSISKLELIRNLRDDIREIGLMGVNVNEYRHQIAEKVMAHRRDSK